MQAARGQPFAEPVADASCDLEPRHEGSQHRHLAGARLLSKRQHGRPHGRAGVRHRRDVRVVEVETVRQGSVGERRERCGAAGPENDPRAPVRLPPRDDFTHGPPGVLRACADGHGEPVCETQSRGVDHLVGHCPIRRTCDVGADTCGISIDTRHGHLLDHACARTPRRPRRPLISSPARMMKFTRLAAKPVANAGV